MRRVKEGLKQSLAPEETAYLNRIAAEVQLRRGMFKEALVYIRAGLEEARKTEDSCLACKINYVRGVILARMNRYGAAARVWGEVLALASIHKHDSIHVRTLTNLAVLAQHRGNHSRALHMLKRARRVFNKIHDLKGLAMCNDRMVFSYMECDDIPRALRHLKISETLANRLDDDELKATTAFYRGAIHLTQEEFSKALSPLEEARRLFAKLDDRKNLAIVTCELAGTYIRLNQAEKAERLLEAASRLAEQLQSNVVLCVLKRKYAEMAASKGNIQQTMSYYREVLRLTETLGNRNSFLLFHESLAETVKRLGFSLPGLGRLVTRVRTSYAKLGLADELAESETWLMYIARSDISKADR